MEQVASIEKLLERKFLYMKFLLFEKKKPLLLGSCSMARSRISVPVSHFLVFLSSFLHDASTHTHAHTSLLTPAQTQFAIALSLSRSQIIHLPLTLLLLLALSPCLGLAHAVSVPFSLSICLFFVYKFTHNYKNNNNYFTDPQSRKSCSPTSKLRICY